MRRLLTRLAVPLALGIATVVAAPAAAWAVNSIDINPGNVPTTAAEVTQNCSPDQGGGPYSNEDVWVFVLPGKHSDSGDFATLVATFTIPGVLGTTSLVLPNADPNVGGFLNGGPDTSKAFLRSPAGWTLTGATAMITGSGDFFTLSHACAADGTTPTPPVTTPPVTTPPTTTPPGTPPATATTTPGGGGSSSSSSSAGSPPGSPTIPTQPPSGGHLPVTGVAIGGFVLVGLALIAGGSILVMIRRREDRRSTETQ
jgi:LPXTG-motif cell wall-anchored protein